MIKICEECLIKTMCIDACKKLQYPEGKEIFIYLKDRILLDRLCSKHRKEKIRAIYNLSKTESMIINEEGFIYYRDISIPQTIKYILHMRKSEEKSIRCNE